MEYVTGALAILHHKKYRMLIDRINKNIDKIKSG